jgi:hypothetical protein
MLHRLALAAALLAGLLGRARAADIQDACSSELSLLCPAARSPSSQAACLKKHKDVLLPPCRAALGEAVKPPPAEEPEEPETGAAGAPITRYDARLTKVSGPVHVHTSKMGQDEFVDAEEGMPLSDGDLVKTGPDASAELALDGESVIELSADTEFTVGATDTRDAEFKIGFGSMLAKLKSLLPGQTMHFQTANSVAAIRGTELAIQQGQGDAPGRIGVLDEGHVAVTAAGGGPEVALGPNQETQVEAGKPPAAARPLTSFAEEKRRIADVRKRVDDVKKDWKPMSRAQRQAARRRLAERPRVPASGPKGMAPPGGRRGAGRGQRPRSGVQPRGGEQGRSTAPKAGPSGPARKGGRRRKAPSKSPSTPPGNPRPSPPR